MTQPEIPCCDWDYDGDGNCAGHPAPRHVHVDLAKGPDRTGVIVQRTWECREHKHILLQGEACPDCGKQLLLD